MHSTFECLNCKKIVEVNALGTKNRNHCPYCLFSVHLDDKDPGDRASTCISLMSPVGIVFKTRVDYDQHDLLDEPVLVHKCSGCSKMNFNRIAGDDNPQALLRIAQSMTDRHLCMQITSQLPSKAYVVFDISNPDHLTSFKDALFGRQ